MRRSFSLINIPGYPPWDLRGSQKWMKENVKKNRELSIHRAYKQNFSIAFLIFFISIKGERSLNFPFPSSSRLNLENSQILPSRQRDNVLKLQRQENFENMASLSRQCCRMTISGNDVNGSRSSLLFRSFH